jgi:hypothetical protein
MKSCSNVVDVTLTYVVVELMHWVSWICELWWDLLLLLEIVRVLVNWWIFVELFMWRTKMNFWYMKLLTEFLVLLGELNLVEFLFSCCDFVSRVVWEKTGFSCENSSVNRFEKWVWCEVLENDFGMIETWIFLYIMIELSVRRM